MKADEIARIVCDLKGALRIPCWIQPRASRSKISGMHGDCLKIALAAPPVDGKANAELCEFLSDILEIPKSSVEIVSGLTGRRKCVMVSGVSLARLQGVLCE